MGEHAVKRLVFVLQTAMLYDVTEQIVVQLPGSLAFVLYHLEGRVERAQKLCDVVKYVGEEELVRFYEEL